MTEKSRLVSLLLTILFGPLGLLYSSIAGGLILTVGAILSAPTIVGPVACWILAILIGDHCTHKHNKGIREFKSAIASRQQAE